MQGITWTKTDLNEWSFNDYEITGRLIKETHNLHYWTFSVYHCPPEGTERKLHSRPVHSLDHAQELAEGHYRENV